ncbi:hypothetical protein AAHE18_14G120200 [Arachis hypogaea]
MQQSKNNEIHTYDEAPTRTSAAFGPTPDRAVGENTQPTRDKTRHCNFNRRGFPVLTFRHINPSVALSLSQKPRSSFLGITSSSIGHCPWMQANIASPFFSFPFTEYKKNFFGYPVFVDAQSPPQQIQHQCLRMNAHG